MKTFVAAIFVACGFSAAAVTGQFYDPLLGPGDNVRNRRDGDAQGDQGNLQEVPQPMRMRGGGFVGAGGGGGYPDTQLPSASAQQPSFARQAVPVATVVEAGDRADGFEHGKGYHHKHGHVGPVYTFVKTDYDANFKWGVRHVAGKEYGKK